MYNLEVYQICNVTYDCMLGVESWRVPSVQLGWNSLENDFHFKEFVFQFFCQSDFTNKIMKRHVQGILLVMQAILCPLLCSCSNNECLDLYEGEEIVKQFNEAKISTSAHNTMLENTYASIVESPINLQKASIEDEDECSMRTSHGTHKEHWLFTFPTSLLNASKQRF